MRTTDLLIAAEMLEMAAHDFGGHHICNDYEIPNTPENLDFVKRMIAESDYPNDEPHIMGDNIAVMDWQVMGFLSRELKQRATERAVAAATTPPPPPPPCPDCGRPMTRREPWVCANCGEEMDV